MKVLRDPLKLTTVADNGGGPSSARPILTIRICRPHGVRPSNIAFSYKPSTPLSAALHNMKMVKGGASSLPKVFASA